MFLHYFLFDYDTPFQKKIMSTEAKWNGVL